MSLSALLNVVKEFSSDFFVLVFTDTISYSDVGENGFCKNPALRPKRMIHIPAIHACVLSIGFCWFTVSPVCFFNALHPGRTAYIFPHLLRLHSPCILSIMVNVYDLSLGVPLFSCSRMYSEGENISTDVFRYRRVSAYLLNFDSD